MTLVQLIVPHRLAAAPHAARDLPRLNAMSQDYLNPGPTREQIDATSGAVLLEFGTAWCGHCQAAAPAVGEALSGQSEIQHIKVEDGPGRRLGRSFRVKLWPTLIALKDGVEVARAVRPETREEVAEVLAKLS